MKKLSNLPGYLTTEISSYGIPRSFNAFFARIHHVQLSVTNNVILPIVSSIGFNLFFASSVTPFLPVLSRSVKPSNSFFILFCYCCPLFSLTVSFLFVAVVTSMAGCPLSPGRVSVT